jgi:hypothetical protein
MGQKNSDFQGSFLIWCRFKFIKIMVPGEGVIEPQWGKPFLHTCILIGGKKKPFEIFSRISRPRKKKICKDGPI